MRDLVYDIVDLLELIFLEPLGYNDEVKEIPFARSKMSGWVFSVISALSIATGMSLLSPPYTIATFGFLGFGFIANLVVLRFFPFIICIILDFYAQRKGRSGKVGVLLGFSRHAIILFSLFAPISLIFLSAGLYGRGIGVLLLIFFFFLYALFLGRGGKYIYELKDQDAFRFAYTALVVTIFFPILFNLYTASTVLQSIAGGF